MTAAEWEASKDPDDMLRAAGKRIPERVLWLFACGAARRVHHLLPDYVRAMLERAEQAADLPPGERVAVLREAVEGVGGTTGFMIRAGLRIDRPRDAAQQVAMMLRWLERRPSEPTTPLGQVWSLVQTLPLIHQPSPEQAAVLRCVAGNPFRKTKFDPAWRTSTVLALARAADAEHTSDNYPILADALQDAGCSDDAVLNHLRPPAHARGCWVLNGVLRLA